MDKVKEIKVRQRWLFCDGSLWSFDRRYVVVVSISESKAIVLNEDTLRKSTLKKKTLSSRFLYMNIIRKDTFQSLLKERENR